MLAYTTLVLDAHLYGIYIYICMHVPTNVGVGVGAGADAVILSQVVAYATVTSEPTLTHAHNISLTDNNIMSPWMSLLAVCCLLPAACCYCCCRCSVFFEKLKKTLIYEEFRKSANLAFQPCGALI